MEVAGSSAAMKSLAFEVSIEFYLSVRGREMEEGVARMATDFFVEEAVSEDTFFVATEEFTDDPNASSFKAFGMLDEFRDRDWIGWWASAVDG